MNPADYNCLPRKGNRPDFRHWVDDQRNALERKLPSIRKDAQDDARNDLERKIRSEALHQFGFTIGSSMVY